MLARAIRAILIILRRAFSVVTRQDGGRVSMQDSVGTASPTRDESGLAAVAASGDLRLTVTDAHDSELEKEKPLVISTSAVDADSKIDESLQIAPAEQLDLGAIPELLNAPTDIIQHESVEKDRTSWVVGIGAGHDLVADSTAGKLSLLETDQRSTTTSTAYVCEANDAQSEVNPPLSVEPHSAKAHLAGEGPLQHLAGAEDTATADLIPLSDSDQLEASMLSGVLAEPGMDASRSESGGSISPTDNGITTSDVLMVEINTPSPNAIELNRSAQVPKSGIRTRSSSDPGEHAPPLRAPQRSSTAVEDNQQPFTGAILKPLPREYLLWNKAIVLHCLQMHGSDNEPIYLTITPTILAGTLAQLNGIVLTPEEALTSFEDAISAMYRNCVLPHAKKLQVLRRCGDDGLPECAAFLAASVLAAYKMRTEDGILASAYYRRLEELLRCGMSGSLPRGFEGDDFEGLWVFFHAWFVRAHSRHIAMPLPDSGPRRFVAFPLMHVPLRQVDIERLPDFFDWAGYEPGEAIAIDKIKSDLIQWTRARGGFTVSGMNALNDERRPAVLAQITQELECWDGLLVDAQGKTVASVEVFLYWQRRMPVLSYLPRRPSVFPSVFDDGLHVLDAGQEGWYEPVPINGDEGPELQSGFTWEAVANGIRFVLRRVGGDAIAMAPSEFDGPLSHSSLLVGTSGAVLCADAVVDRVSRYLETVTGRRSTPATGSGVPVGWKLFFAVKPIRASQPPDGLEMLNVTTRVAIVPEGGLRLGRRWAWLADAPPKLTITGVDPTVPILIDGEVVHTDEDGVIECNGHLSRPGVHFVEVGRQSRRLEMLLPELPADIPAQCDRRLTAAALPAGSWTVIGSCPGEVAYASSGRLGKGAIVSCPFEPVWAVSFSGGRGAVVRPLVEPLPPPGKLGRRFTKRSLGQIGQWAEAVYGSHIRRPTFLSGSPLLVDQGTYSAWRAYVNTAREVKQVLRSERR